MRIGGNEHELVIRLRAGDDSAFVELVECYHARLVRLATVFVRRSELAEDVAQDTWIALLTGIDRFEERSSLGTWLFQVCVNRARSLAVREHRTIPVENIDPLVEADHTGDRFDTDLVDVARSAIAELPVQQRLVVTLRDVEGRSGAETGAVLSISAANQRVLLHRGRTQVRNRIDAARARPIS